MKRFLLSPWHGTEISRGLARAGLNVAFGFLVGAFINLVLGFTLGFAFTVLLAIPALWCMFVLAERFGRIERSRARALLGVDLASPHEPLESGGWGSRLFQRLSSPSRWREIAFLALGLPALGALSFLVLSAWSLSLALAVTPFVSRVDFGGIHRFGLFHSGHALGSLASIVVGVIGILIVAPWLTRGLLWIDRRIVRWLLGPPSTEVLSRRVSELEVSRDAAVGHAEADLRRIERDLHDGAQQRLVALAIDLGRARERFESDPPGARRLVEEAHEEAKAALVELRDLARGIHPAVLTDRGLDAALSAVVTRCPVPVFVSLDLPTRPPPAVERAAYFVVSEALTNVAKHSHATRAQVTIVLQNNRLTLDIRDNGTGGADPAKGTGLAGLVDRVAALGGWTKVLSPEMGPTSIMVEFPCAL